MGLGRRFLPGELVAGRYRIERYCGSGAAADVYAAFDLLLGSKIALKVLHELHGSGPEGRNRFRREVLLARRISHPNVCRIYDFGVHEDGADSQVHYMTMELLEGETLAERIRRQGCLPEKEALELARQLAAGLEAAHKAGVVHRDFKSSNVLLVPQAEGIRAVITDFGLARAWEGSSQSATLTQDGAVLGTPAYMAPEQVEGKSADARSDLYALGVVLFELLSGCLPFEGESALSVALKRLKQPPRSLIRLQSGLSAKTVRIVEKCLERDPKDRFQSATELLAALDSEKELGWSRSRVRRIVRVLSASLVAAGFAVLLGIFWDRLGRRDKAAEVPRIAVLGVRVLPNVAEESWRGTALAEMLGSELAASGEITVVPASYVEALKGDFQLRELDQLDGEAVRRLRKILNTRTELVGTLVRLATMEGERLRLDIREALPGEPPLPPVVAEGTSASFFDMAAQAGAALRKALGLQEARLRSRGEEGVNWQLREPAAVQAYGEARVLFARGRLQEAAGRLAEALDKDGDFVLARSLLARVWWDLGYRKRAAAEAQEAYRGSLGLSEENQLLLETQFRRYQGDYGAARKLLAAWHALQPNDTERLLERVALELESGEGPSALALVEAAARGVPQERRDLRLLWLSARTYGLLTRFESQHQEAELLVARSRELGAERFELLAELQRAAALRRLGQPEPARRALERARELSWKLKDPLLEAETWELAGQVERIDGRWSAAETHFEKARDHFQALGNESAVARVGLALGAVALQSGQTQRAIGHFESALSRLSALEEVESLMMAEVALGGALASSGQFAASESRYLSGCTAAARLGKLASEGYCWLGLATVSWARADLQRSEELTSKAEALANASGDRRLLGLVGAMRAEALLARGQLDQAIAEAVRSREILEMAGAGQNAREVRWLELRARLEKDPGSAELRAELARFIDDLLRGDSLPPGSELQCAEALRLELRLNPEGTRRRSLAKVSAHLERSPEWLVRATARLFAVELALGDGKLNLARELAQALATEARQRGARFYELEAELLLARFSRSQEELANVCREVAELGFLLMARNSCALNLQSAEIRR